MTEGKSLAASDIVAAHTLQRHQRLTAIIVGAGLSLAVLMGLGGTARQSAAAYDRDSVLAGMDVDPHACTGTAVATFAAAEVPID